MSRKFSGAFKSNVVEKTINRNSDVTLDDIANEYGINTSTVGRWHRESQQQTGEQAVASNKEKRPQDWSVAEKLQAVIDCGHPGYWENILYFTFIQFKKRLKDDSRHQKIHKLIKLDLTR